MTVTPAKRKKIFERDEGVCWHCGKDDNLTIHHRTNRGMGGSKLLDRYSNLILMCVEYNFLMEANLDVVREALERGLKVRRHQSGLYVPLKRFDGSEWLLDDFGKKHEIDVN